MIKETHRIDLTSRVVFLSVHEKNHTVHRGWSSEAYGSGAFTGSRRTDADF